MLPCVGKSVRIILSKTLLIFLFGISIQGCSSLGDLFSKDSDSDKSGIDEYAGWTIQQFRTEAKKAVESGNYEKAIKLYESLESRYPFGESSAQTQLDVAYAYFKNNDPESALAAADRFIKINPRSPNIDYAYYLKGLINYNRDIGFMDRFLPTDTSQRDTSNADEAYRNFELLIKRFPSSQYNTDARLRMIALKNNSAMYEVHVARYYLKRKAYLSAINRAASVLKTYQRTPAVPFALQVMIESYAGLDMQDLRDSTQAIYDKNFPNGPPVPEFKNATLSHRFWDFMGFEK
ncbi:MAG: outer membrane protein assembly factor BamD [Methylococcaceae bacterium]|jgi:outer membrane protein assembly factor BamD|nr:MAG: outer membrane protein assembly factor BamD [Methylococcaceae bacterium]